MNENGFENKLKKETLKAFVDNNSNISMHDKQAIKSIIDAGQNYQQIIQTLIVYFIK